MFARAIREGIGHDGRALFPLMPYQNFREFSDEDIASLVVYLKSLLPEQRTSPFHEKPDRSLSDMPTHSHGEPGRVHPVGSMAAAQAPDHSDSISLDR